MIRGYLENNVEGSQFFKWKEALWLHKWEIYAFPIDSYIWENIRYSAYKMDMIRKILDKPIIINSWYRPPKYNQFIDGAESSSHIQGKAVDFIVDGMDCDRIREILFPKLVMLNIRMENKPKSNWIHIDTNCTEDMDLKKRYFIP